MVTERAPCALFRRPASAVTKEVGSLLQTAFSMRRAGAGSALVPLLLLGFAAPAVAEDCSPEVTVTASRALIYEGQNAIFVFHADCAPSADLRVRYVIKDTYGAAGGKKGAVEHATIRAGTRTARVRIRAADMRVRDAINCVAICTKEEEREHQVDRHGTISVDIDPLPEPPPGYRSARPSRARVSVRDARYRVPQVGFAAARSTVMEGDGTVDVKVTVERGSWDVGRGRESAFATTVRYTVSGTATPGEDFTIVNSGNLKIPEDPTTTSVVIPVTIVDDKVEDSDETVVLTLLKPNYNHELDAIHRHTLIITNDDLTPPPPPTPAATFAAASSTAQEDAGTQNVVVNLNPTPQTGITLSYRVAGSAASGSDYTALSGTVTVTAGASSVNIPVAITDDSAQESSETIILTLTAGSGYTVGSTGKHTLTITDDDAPPPPPTPPPPTPLTPLSPPTLAATFAVASSTAQEDAGTRNVVVNLNPAPQTGITLSYRVAGSAASGSDYTALSGTVTVTAGASSVNIPVAITDDSAQENSETIILTLTGGTGYTVGSTGSHTLTITDDDTPPPPPRRHQKPEATFAAASSSAGEGAGTHNIQVTLSSQPSAGITIGYSVGGSAVAGSDYTSLSWSVSVQAGTSSVNIPVAITDDSEQESSETIILTLTADSGYTVGSPGQHTLTITDDDAPVATFAMASSKAGEDAGTRNVAVNLSPAPQSGITLRYSVGGTASSGSDYSPLSGTVTVSSGASSVNIPVTIIDDDVQESSETIILTLTADSGYTVGSTGKHTLTITANDVPPPAPTPVATFAATSSTAGENAGTRNVAVNLSPAPQSGITLRYSVGGTASSGSDYTITNSGTVAVSSGASSVNIPVTITDDNVQESSETVILTLTAGSGYQVGSPAKHTLTITANDAPPPPPPKPIATVSIHDASAEEGQEMTFTVRIEPAASSPMILSWTMVDVSAVAGEDYSGSGGTVTVAAGAGTASFQVTTVDDRIDEDDETFTVTLSDDLPAGVSFAAAGGVATGTIHDDDTAGIGVSEPELSISARGRSAHYTVRLESEPEAPVTIAVTSGDSGVATASPQRLVFTSADWNSAKTVTITGVGSGSAVVVHQASSVDPNYDGRQVKVSIRVEENLEAVAVSWLARFARTSAGTVLDGITNRWTALRTPGFEGAVAGRPIEFAAPPEAEGSVLAVFGDRLPGPDYPDYQPLAAGEVLPTTAFALSGKQAEGGGSLALWGRGAWSHFDGTDGTYTLDGDVATGILGVDGVLGSWLLGMALAHNAGTGGYHQASEKDGDLQATLTIAAPYAVGRVSDRLTVYGTLGYGGGSLTVEPLDRKALNTKTGFAMAAAGTRVDIVQAERTAGFGLTATTDALLLRASSQAAGDALSAFDADVSQLRVGLTGSWRYELAAFGALQPRLEIGARHDGGHAETGVGLEVGGGVMWSLPILGLGVSAESRGLVTHVADSLMDWGASAAVSWDLDPGSAVGPALSLRHDWGGASANGFNSLASATGFNLTESDSGRKLLTAEAAWGFSFPNAGLVGAPYLGFSGTDSARDYTFGWRLNATDEDARDFSIGVSTTYSEREHKADDHRLGVELSSRW